MLNIYMNKEEREDIIANNNTAQEEFVTFLEKLAKPIQKVELTGPLYGDVDASVFVEQNLGVPKEITFKEGKITSIKNIPEGVESIICVNNLLEELENLPKSITKIDVEYNFLKEIDVSALPQLESINISNNEIKELTNLPSSLIELKCTNNKLESLDLKNLDNLRTLHISNNLITVISNLSESIVDFQKENVPDFEIRDTENLGALQSNEQEKTRKFKKDYYKEIGVYFKLKNNYEKKEKKMKKDAYEKGETKKMAKQNVLKVKMPCIKCERKVGTIFNQKDYTYFAICGDSVQPCGLNIKLYSGDHYQYINAINMFKKDIEVQKEAIIKHKLDNIFGYTTDADAKVKYENSLSEFNEDNGVYTEFIDLNESLFENVEKKENMEKKEIELEGFINENKIIMEQLNETNKRELMKDVVANNVNNVFRTARNIRDLKNEINEVEYDKSKKIYTLIQYPVKYAKLEIMFGGTEKVLNFER